MRLVLFLLFSCAVLNSNALKLIEEVKPGGNVYDIPFQKYTLDNGLIVILHKDTTVNKVNVNVKYKVGSSDEKKGQRGWAHFFEHLMFFGTKSFSKYQLWSLFPNSNESDFNASTTNEFTEYYCTIPSDYLNLALHFESERMQSPAQNLSQEIFENEKKVVLNEYTLRKKENMEGRAYNEVNNLLYPEDHPMFNNVLAKIDDIKNADYATILSTFKTWYVPNNAILTITGNFNTDTLLHWISTYFDPIKAGNSPTRDTVFRPIQLDEIKSTSFEANTKFYFYNVVFPTINRWHEDECKLDAFSYLMNQKDNPKRFFDNDATSIYAFVTQLHIFHPCTYSSGEFRITFDTDKQISAVKLKSLLQSTLKTITKKGFSEENMVEYKKYFQNKIFERINSISGIGEMLSMYEVRLGTPNGLPIEWKRNLNLKEKEIINAVNKYIYNTNYILAEALPFSKDAEEERGQIELNSNGNKEYRTSMSLLPASEKKALQQYNKFAIVTNFKSMPYWIDTLSNNMMLLGTYFSNVPTSVLVVAIKAGEFYNTTNYSGFPSLFCFNGNVKTDVFGFKNKLNGLGADIVCFSDKQNIFIRLECQDKTFKEAVEILKRIIFESCTNTVNLDKIVYYYNKNVGNQLFNPHTANDRMLNMAFYNPESKLHFYPYGKKEDINNFIFNPEGAPFWDILSKSQVQFYYAGSKSKSQLHAILHVFDDWNTNFSQNVSTGSSLNNTKTNIYLNDRVGSEMSYITIGFKTIPKSDTRNFMLLQIASNILSGSFNNRINSRLREKKGYSYSSYSTLPIYKFDDIFTISTSVDITKTDSALIFMIDEINRFVHDGVSDEELNNAIRDLYYAETEIPESQDAKITFLTNIDTESIAQETVKTKLEILNSITLQTINDFISNTFKNNNYQIAITTDKLAVKKMLENMSFPVLELSSKLY